MLSFKMKREMKKIIKYMVLLGTVSPLVFSCSKFLDQESYSYASDGFYNKEEGIKQAVNGIYPNLYIDLNWSVNAMIVMDHYTPLALEGTVQNTSIGAGAGLLPANAAVNTLWKGMYALIASANNVIYGASSTINNMSEAAKTAYAEARVLRAYAYYNLIGLYGDVPFFKQPVDLEDKTIQRTSKIEILDFIIQELEDAANALPWEATQRGRISKAAAYGIEARAALLGGSLDFGGKGKSYFGTAASAASKVIGKRNLATNFKDLFTLAGQTKADVKSELIWELMYSNTASIKKNHTSGWGHSSRNYGSSVRYPSLLLAETFECKDGKRIDESPLYDPKKPNKNRDPRFSATLLMDGDTAAYYSTTGVRRVVIDAYNSKTKFWMDASKGWYEDTNQDIVGSTATASFANVGAGYLWYKYGDESSESLSAQSCNIAILRYAEVLLTYAEAKIELGELDQSVYDAINTVRKRAGMPNVANDRMGNLDKMRQLVRRERKVELILEGLHSIDMRRWDIGDLENSEPSYGIPLETIKYQGLSLSDVPNFKASVRHDLNDIASHAAFKEKLKVRDQNRYWDPQFSLWPIPQIEIDRNSNLKQNDGY